MLTGVVEGSGAVVMCWEAERVVMRVQRGVYLPANSPVMCDR